MDKAEARWLQGARRFDEGALSSIYEAYSDELYRYAFRLLGSANAAEDLVAETFCRFLCALHAGGGPRSHLRAYLYRVAHNAAIDQHRRRGSEEMVGDVDPPPEDRQRPPEVQAEAALKGARLREALWDLTEEQRQVILLKFFQGMSNSEVGRALDKPVGAVKSLQHRGLRALERILERPGEVKEAGG